MQKDILSQVEVEEALAFVKARITVLPEIALILGSGLGQFADEIENATIIPTGNIPHYPVSTVEGHAGKWILGSLAGKQVLALKGRIHSYEGYTFQVITFPVHLFAELGISKLIVTNAAGGLNRDFRPGDLMLIDDHVNMMFGNPLIGINNDRIGPRFPDMSQPYDKKLIKLAQEAGSELGIALRRGVLAALRGPAYESAAEVRMMQRLGADAGTMSTVPEVITAAYRGLQVLGISCITNLGTGISAEPLSHDEVTEVADLVKDRFSNLIKAIVARM